LKGNQKWVVRGVRGGHTASLRKAHLHRIEGQGSQRCEGLAMSVAVTRCADGAEQVFADFWY